MKKKKEDIPKEEIDSNWKFVAQKGDFKLYNKDGTIFKPKKKMNKKG